MKYKFITKAQLDFGMKQNNKIIIKNTIAQYIKTIVSVIVSIYTARVILHELGVEDYGIYSVIASFIALFGVLNASMIVSIQRFLSCEIADNNKEEINRIYSTSILSHIGLALIVLLLAETIGVYFVSEHMVFPEGKLHDALFVFHCVAITFAINIISIPQQAVLISFEKIFLSSIVGIIESFLKLGIAIVLMYFSDNKLIIYATLFAAVSIMIRLLYSIAIKLSLKELKFKWHFTKETFKKVTGFASWNLFGGIANLGKIQGVNIILNLFFGTVVNAAYGLANQINSQLLFFSSSIFQASNSQIIQSYKRNDYNRLGFLVSKSAKSAFIMYFIISMPLLTVTDEVIYLWLGEVPKYCSIFVILMLLNSYIELFSSPLMLITQATGQIKKYFITISSVMILILPLSYIALKNGASPYAVLYITIIINLILLGIRLYYVSYNAHFPIAFYVKQVIAPAFTIIIMGTIASHYLSINISVDIYRILVALITSPVIVILLSFLILLNKSERHNILKYVRK